MVIIITFIILIFSAIVHEVAHGVMAERLGDSTARDAGRITLNPISHIDPYGTILVPLLLYYGTGGRFWFGSAKPVPVNFDNLNPRRLGMALVSFAGPLSNFLLAIVFALITKFNVPLNGVYQVALIAVYINLLLGTFNLIPIPPLDGSKIILSMAPESWMYHVLKVERYGFVLVLLFVYSGFFGIIFNPVATIFFNIFHLSFNDLYTLLS